MTQADIVFHWQKGARESMQLAEKAHEMGSFTLALFHCQLAVEKALKALYIEQHGEDAPRTHELQILAEHVQHHLAEEQIAQLDELTNYSVGARYDEIEWSAAYATEENSALWLDRTRSLLSALLP